MTKDEALKLALEALEFALHVGFDESSASQSKKGDKAWLQHKKAITAIKQALAAPVQEIEYCTDYHCAGDCGQPHNQKEMREFLTAAQRPWVGLTDEERNHARHTVTYSQLAMTAGEWAEAVQIETEKRLKEKNT